MFRKTSSLLRVSSVLYSFCSSVFESPYALLPFWYRSSTANDLVLLAVAALRGDSGVDSRRRRDGDDAMLVEEPTFFRMDLFFKTASMLGESWEVLSRAV